MTESARKHDAEGPSRRNFMKTSTAAVVTGALAGGLSITRSAHAAGDDTIRIGLIGCGGRGSGAASQALHTQGSVKLVAMGDAFDFRLNESYNNLEKEEELKGKIDVPPERRFVGFDAYKQVLAAGVDLVILATPPGFRPIHLAAAIDAGKHVFAEKPVAVDGATGVRSNGRIGTAKRKREKFLAHGDRHAAPSPEQLSRNNQALEGWRGR